VPRNLRELLLRPTLPELWLFLAVALPVLASLIAPLPTVDLAYQLRAGADVLAGRGIPTVDTWTFTAAGQPWLDQQWGAQAVLAAVHGATGWSGLAILRAALVGLYAFLVLLAIHRRAPGSSGRGSAILVIAAFIVTSPALALRPQLLAMVAFAVTLVLLAGRREHPRIAWLVPVVAIVWANLHGSFIVAPVLVGFAWLEDIGERSSRAGPTFIVGLLTVVATLVTPFGLDAWRYAADLAANPVVRERISEWQPTTLGDAPGILFWGSVAIVLLLVVRQVRTPGVVTPPAVATLVAFAALGAVAARGIAWWPAVAVVTLAGIAVNARLADRTARGIPADAPPKRRLDVQGSSWNNHVALTLVLTGLVALPVWRPADEVTGAPDGLLAYAPSGVTGSLRLNVHPTDRVWNPQVWGSWLEFAVPEATYAFDSRIELFSAAAWATGDRVNAAVGDWSRTLDELSVTIVVTEGPMTDPLPLALAGNPGWLLAFADAEGAIWVRELQPLGASARLSSGP